MHQMKLPNLLISCSPQLKHQLPQHFHRCQNKIMITAGKEPWIQGVNILPQVTYLKGRMEVLIDWDPTQILCEHFPRYCEYQGPFDPKVIVYDWNKPNICFRSNYLWFFNTSPWYFQTIWIEEPLVISGITELWTSEWMKGKYYSVTEFRGL